MHASFHRFPYPRFPHPQSAIYLLTLSSNPPPFFSRQEIPRNSVGLWREQRRTGGEEDGEGCKDRDDRLNRDEVETRKKERKEGRKEGKVGEMIHIFYRIGKGKVSTKGEHRLPSNRRSFFFFFRNKLGVINGSGGGKVSAYAIEIVEWERANN